MATFIVGTIVFACFAGAGFYTYRKKKKSGSCCSGCKGCPHSSSCH